MAEGRKSQIILLDDRQLEILIQPKLYTEELLDLVASHFNLKEKEYFGLAFQDETGHFNWLHLDRKVLEHEFPKRTGSLILYFSVRFFIESIAYLRDNATVELFYLQAKQAIAKGDLECDSETAFELAAYVLQATFGDYSDDETSKHHLRKLPVLPTSALRAHPSISYCEDQVLGHYVKLGGQSRGSAIVSYMTIVESLPTYGIHYYEVKDKSGIPWWLGLSYKGISQYDHNDKKTPRRVFSWKQLENLYFRDKKFSIEVHDPKRIVHTLSSFNLYEDAIQEPIEEFDSLSDAISDPTTQVSVSRRTFGPGNVNVHAWFSSSPQLTKCIWSMAVNQHQFYLDRKQTKTQLPTVRSMSEIAADLSQSMTSLPSSGLSDGISRSNSAHSLSHIPSTNSIKVEMSMEQMEASRAAKQEMITALKSRKETLEETLKEKLEALKALCIQEGELTGELPPETPLAPGEKPPVIRRRVGTEFTLSPKVMQDSRNQGEQYLSKLEMEYELQDQITKAAHKLAQDTSVAKTVRKKRKHSYHRAHQKLKDLEKKLNEARKYAGFAAVKAGYSSVEDLSCDSEGYLDSEPEFISPIGSPSPRRNKGHKGPEVEVVDLQKQPVTQPLPQTPQSGGMTRGSTPSPQGQRRLGGGYTPSSVYTTRTHYRTQTYPTFTSQPQPTNNSQYDNLDMVGSKMGEPNGPRMYPNVHYSSPQRALRYDSADELKSSSHEDGLDAAYSDDESYSRTKYGSLEGHYKRRSREFPEGRLLTTSLERNRSSPMLLPELTPSRFGSKRESSCDPKESIYPYPTDHMGAHMQPHAEHVQFQVGAQVTPSYGAPYTGHMQGSPHVPGGTYYSHDMSNMRQQEPPHTPQYEVPPPAFLQEQDVTNRIPQVEPQNVTVKKYQGYMEVSKPFEMSDFYKYSERLRKQHHRPTDHYNVRTAQSSYQSPATPVNRQYASVPNTVQVQQSRSRPGSPFAHRDSVASPKDSPINSVPYHGCRNDNVRGPQVAHPVGGVYQGYHGTQTSPRVMPLQHPQPMTCEPVQGTPIHKNTPDRSYSETQLDRHRAIVGDFGDEMLSWYDGQGAGDRSSTLV